MEVDVPLIAYLSFACMGVGLTVGTLYAELLRASDRVTRNLSLAALLSLLLGGLFVVAHLGHPENALRMETIAGMLEGLGRSRLTQETVLFLGTTLLVFLYALVAFLAPRYRRPVGRPLIALASAVGLVYLVWQGLLYMMPSYPIWNSPLVPLFRLMWGLLFATVSLTLVEVLIPGAGKRLSVFGLATLALASLLALVFVLIVPHGRGVTIEAYEEVVRGGLSGLYVARFIAGWALPASVGLLAASGEGVMRKFGALLAAVTIAYLFAASIIDAFLFHYIAEKPPVYTAEEVLGVGA